MAISITRQYDNEIIELHARGFGERQIARELSKKTGDFISRTSIARARKRIGLGANKTQRTVVSESVEKTIVELHHEGFGAKLKSREIEKRHGIKIDHCTILYHCKRLGLNPHIGSSNGGHALREKRQGLKTPGQIIKQQHEEQRKRMQREKSQGTKGLPLFSAANLFKTKYRKDPEFRHKQIQKVKRWKSKNPEKAKEHASIYWSRWADANPDKVKESIRRNRSKPENKVINNLRKRVRDVIKGRGYSATAIIKGIGCTRSDLIDHIESQFTIGMTWENYGEWHIDHIVPLSSAKCECFDTTVSNLSRLNHYTNLQPLWADENLRKSDTMPVIRHGGGAWDGSSCGGPPEGYKEHPNKGLVSATKMQVCFVIT
jgi:hypothetical protein